MDWSSLTDDIPKEESKPEPEVELPSKPKKDVITPPVTPKPTPQRKPSKSKREIIELQQTIADLIIQYSNLEKEFLDTKEKLLDHLLTPEKETVIDLSLFDFDEFMIDLESDKESPSGFHLKDKLNVRGKHKKINRERVIRNIRDVLNFQKHRQNKKRRK